MVGRRGGIGLLSLLLSPLLGLGGASYGALSQVVLLVLVLVLSPLLLGRGLGEVILADASNASLVDIVLVTLLLALTLLLLGAANLRDVAWEALSGVGVRIMDA